MDRFGQISGDFSLERHGAKGAFGTVAPSSRFFGGVNTSGAFDPLSLNPILAFEASRSMLAAGDAAAGNLDSVAALENRVSGGANATQTSAPKQPRAHVPVGGGHLYLPSVSGNSASVTFPSISTSEDFVFTIEVHLLNSTDFYLVSGASSSHRFAVFNGYFYMGTQFIALDSSLSTGDSTLTVERSGATISLKQDGVTKASKNTSVSFDLTHLSFNQQFASSILGLNGHIKTATLSVAGTEELNIDFSNATHKASSFVCSTGQTVSINTSGQDPATIVNRSFLRFDGANTSLVGVFNDSNTQGGYFFASFSVNGNGGPSSARVFVMKSSDASFGYNSDKAFLWSLRRQTHNDLAYYHSHNFRGIHTGKWNPDNGVILHEVKAIAGQQFSRVNNSDEQSTTLSLSNLSSEDFHIGQDPVGTGVPAIDLEALYLFDHTLTDSNATKVRDYLNAKSSIY